jgi:hypothetical membrane protein
MLSRLLDVLSRLPGLLSRLLGKRGSTPWWALLSATLAPVLLIGGWTLAARRQPAGYDPFVETISSLAALGARDRWLMTAALVGVGACHMTTALGLAGAAVAGRIGLGAGGVATVLVAAFPQPATGGSAAHTVAAAAAFGTLALWPAVAWPPSGRHASAPVPLRPVVSIAAALVLVGLVGWFALALRDGELVGLSERVAAAAQALWPLVVAASVRRVRR